MLSNVSRVELVLAAILLNLPSLQFKERSVFVCERERVCVHVYVSVHVSFSARACVGDCA